MMGPPKSPLLYWDRHAQVEKVEQIYGGQIVRWLYQTRLGQILMDSVISQPWISRIYGAFQNCFLSRAKIQPFIQKFQIATDEYEEADYANFNEFFTRKFKTHSRSFTQVPAEMPACTEARYLAYASTPIHQKLPVKTALISPKQLLGDPSVATLFLGGPALICRLCPTDYHRFHFPDSGKLIKTYSIPGRLHSVNPLALAYKKEIFLINERQVSLLETENFGLIAYVEVGATCVGRIVQTYNQTYNTAYPHNQAQTHDKHPISSFVRGEEKGYFLFGGSTVILLGQPGRWQPDADLLERTERQQETWVRLGERVAKASPLHST